MTKRSVIECIKLKNFELTLNNLLTFILQKCNFANPQTTANALSNKKILIFQMNLLKKNNMNSL